MATKSWAALAALMALTTSRAYAVACVSAASGNWSTPSTWLSCSGGSPSNGDTVTISHAVTVTVSATTGHSPAAGDVTAAILINSGGSLTVNTGVTLTVRGDIRLNNTPMTMQAGSVLEFDASLAASPSTARYLLQIGTANGQTGALFTSAGTSGSRVTIRSNAAGANARISNGGFTGVGRALIDFTDLTRIGDASNVAFSFWPSLAGYTWRLKDSTCTACGSFQMNTTPNATASITIENNTWSGTVSSHCTNHLYGASGPTLRLVGNVFDKVVNGISAAGWIITDNVFMGRFSWTGGPWLSFRRNLIHNEVTSGGSVQFFGDSYDSYYVANAANTNPHFLQTTLIQDSLLDGLLFEHLGNNANGDCVMLSSALATTRTVTVRNTIKLPNAAGTSTGTMVSALGNSFWRVVFENNTVHLGGTADSSGLRYGETFAGVADMFQSVKGNLFWDTVVRGWKIHDAQNTASFTGGSANISLGGANPSSPNINDRVFFAGTLPSNIIAGTAYWVVSATGGPPRTIQIATTSGGPAIVASSTATGTGYVGNIVSTGANADFNAGWNYAPGISGKGYTLGISDGTSPGVNDLDANPGFSDPSRNLARRDAFCSGPGTSANFLLEAQKRNTAAYKPCYDIGATIQWVRAGFTPLNPVLQRSGPPNQRFGAISPALMVGTISQ